MISYASLLDENGQVDAYATGAYMQNAKGEYQLQKDEFILDCIKTELAPKFCRHCFRYFKVEGDVSAIQSVDIEVVAVRTVLGDSVYVWLCRKHCGAPLVKHIKVSLCSGCGENVGDLLKEFTDHFRRNRVFDG